VSSGDEIKPKIPFGSARPSLTEEPVFPDGIQEQFDTGTWPSLTGTPKGAKNVFEKLWEGASSVKTYIVTEVVEYEVEARSEEEACEIITQAGDRDLEYFVQVSDRYANEKEEIKHE